MCVTVSHEHKSLISFCDYYTITFLICQVLFLNHLFVFVVNGQVIVFDRLFYLLYFAFFQFYSNISRPFTII